MKKTSCKVTFLVALLCGAALLGSSCSEKGGEPGEARTYEIDRNFRRGPVDFRVAVNRREVTIADRVTLLLETRAADGYAAPHRSSDPH